MQDQDREGPSTKSGPALEHRLADEARFLRTWLENPLGTGAVSPSSRTLARAMARPVDPSVAGPVIELGPGTGPVTEALLRRGIAQERLILIEFDATFCQLLARRYPLARIIQGDAYRLADRLAGVLDAPAAAIVSSLPLLTRPDRTRLDLLSQAFLLLRPGGAFVQFTYGLTSPMPRRRTCALAFDAEVSKPVWLNLPPARVWVYRAASESAAAPVAAPQGVPERSIRLKLKSGTELLGEELRECGDRIRHTWRAKAQKARAELRAGAEHFKSGLRRRAASRTVRAQAWDGLDAQGPRRKGRRPR